MNMGLFFFCSPLSSKMTKCTSVLSICVDSVFAFCLIKSLKLLWIKLHGVNKTVFLVGQRQEIRTVHKNSSCCTTRMDESDNVKQDGFLDCASSFIPWACDNINIYRRVWWHCLSWPSGPRMIPNSSMPFNRLRWQWECRQVAAGQVMTPHWWMLVSNQLAASIIADKVKAAPPPVWITASADRPKMTFTLNRIMLSWVW